MKNWWGWGVGQYGHFQLNECWSSFDSLPLIGWKNIELMTHCVSLTFYCITAHPPKLVIITMKILFLVILQSGLSSVGRFLCFIRYLLVLERSRWLLYPHVWGYHLSWGLVQHLSLWPLQCGWISLSDSLWFQSSFEQHKAQFMRACITSWNKSRGSLGNASVTVSHTWSREKLWVPS